jgi:hypothetical protein
MRRQFLPPRSEEHDLSRQQEKRKGNPARLEPTQLFTQRADIDPMQREMGVLLIIKNRVSQIALDMLEGRLGSCW